MTHETVYKCLIEKIDRKVFLIELFSLFKNLIMSRENILQIAAQENGQSENPANSPAMFRVPTKQFTMLNREHRS